MERFYGYGIVDKDGKLAQVHVKETREEAEAIAAYQNKGKFPNFFLGAPYRVVELFYENEDQP